MNQRIRELAYRADLVIKKSNGNDFRFGAMDPKLEKFAELIVKECVRYFNEDYQRDFDTLWREDLTKGIKEHFGVEE